MPPTIADWAPYAKPACFFDSHGPVSGPGDSAVVSHRAFSIDAVAERSRATKCLPPLANSGGGKLGSHPWIAEPYGAQQISKGGRLVSPEASGETVPGTELPRENRDADKHKTARSEPS